jgi:proline iminopeptidase
MRLYTGGSVAATLRRGLVALALAATGCGADPEVQPSNGFVGVPGGRVWYEIMGTGDATPLLVLHGGPGSVSCRFLHYLDRLAEDRPVITYDQLGSGRSDHPSDTSLWEVARFVDELAAVRAALDLDEVHLMGHSWGGSLAIEYMLMAMPDGVRSLTLVSPLVDTERWTQDANLLRAELPADIQAVLQAGDETGDFSSPEYLAASDSFYARHVVRSGWPPAQVAECEGSPGFNAEVYGYMWGPNEFTATGTLQDFDRSERLSELDLPVLFVTGRYDEARPETMAEYQAMVPGSELVIVEDAAHMVYIDQEERFNEAVAAFLRDVEGR